MHRFAEPAPFLRPPGIQAIRVPQTEGLPTGILRKDGRPTADLCLQGESMATDVRPGDQEGLVALVLGRDAS